MTLTITKEDKVLAHVELYDGHFSAKDLGEIVKIINNRLEEVKV